MGFIEGVLCKIHHRIINLIRHPAVNTVCNTAFDSLLFISINEVLSFGVNYILLFLTHGTTDIVRLSHRIACQILHDLHYLLLIHNTAVSRLQNRFQLFTVICNIFRIILPFDIFWNKIHRTGTIQRNSRNHIL